MKRIVSILLGVCCLVSPAPAEPPAAEPKTDAAKAYAEKLAAAQKEAAECHAALQAAYMKNDWSALDLHLNLSRKHIRNMNSDQQKDVTYVRKARSEYRQAWWSKIKSSSNVSFPANIWGRGFIANYVPSEELGRQMAWIRNGKLECVVSWRPNLVDNPKAAEGELAKVHGLTKGDLGEAIVWHELGHNYITNFLPLQHVVALYNDHNLLFHHLQEFYADMTALYHSSAHARLATLMIRLDALEANREMEPHTRMAYGIGSLLLAEFLGNPEKWPSVHFPAAVPEKDVERNTVIYVYENIDPKWTFEEDKALREMVLKFIRAKGEQVLRSKGTIDLPNRLSFKLMEAEDRELKQKRDQWVKEKLEAAIATGRADKPPESADGKKKKTELTGSRRLEIPW
ncbi:MAG TPA: hypothetical protein DCX07_04785 [Phycisphaerales bacterium]|nr:hypothetical protein [Phycisphaerales bacterium]